MQIRAEITTSLSSNLKQNSKTKASRSKCWISFKNRSF